MNGVGEMGPGVFEGDVFIEGVSRNIWYASLLIGKSILGIRAGDAVRLTRLLKKNSNLNEVYIVAIKETAFMLLHTNYFILVFKMLILNELSSLITGANSN